MFNMSSLDKECEIEVTTVAKTLAARDFKGPNNYGFNGVFEIK